MSKIAEPKRGITLGRYLHEPCGKFKTLDEMGAVSALALVLSNHRGPDAWWAPGIFAGDVRRGENWLGTWNVGIDGDYYERGLDHSPPPDELRELAAMALTEALPGSLFHDTPRGFHDGLCLDRFVRDKDEFKKIATAIQRRVEEALSGAGILGQVRRHVGNDKKSVVTVERPGFIVDTGALFDRARLLYTPNATVEGETAPRRADVLILGGAR